MSPALDVSVPVKPAQGIARGRVGNGVETIDSRMLVLLRCVLGFSALAVVLVDPPQIGRLVELAYFAVGMYCAYTVLVAAISSRLEWPAPPRALHWADVVFFSFLIALTGGTSSIFFLFFFYSIMVASFCWGFGEGMLVTVASSALFVAIGLGSPEAAGQGITLVPAAYLLIFGYLISYFGGYERLLRRRLALLREINNLWNPRFGVDHTHGINLDRLLAFYGGNSCVLVLRHPSPALNYVMYSASRDKPGFSSTPSYVAESAAGALLRLPDSLAAFYHGPGNSWWRRLYGFSAYDFDLGTRTKSFFADCAAWANLLDTQAFVTVPYVQRDGTSGRIFLTTHHGGFTYADIDFLAQVSDAMSTVVENISLIEQLISKAAEQERLAISRDLHDTTIQPYIGIKLALDALYREAGTEYALSPRIAELINMAEMTIRDLRQYASTLKDKAAMPGEFLVAAVKNQSERLGRFYGVNVEVKSDISPRLQGRLAAEAYQIIAEGLSNVLRHTAAKKAFVNILCENSQLLLKIGNEAGNDSIEPKSFTPRSISERVQLLGGRTFVEQREEGQTVVHVTIPM
jgi:signal transduction histidine kinase